MKKILFLILFIASPIHAIHRLFIYGDASDLSTGTVSNNRLDNSSFTKMGVYNMNKRTSLERKKVYSPGKLKIRRKSSQGGLK